MKKIRKNSLWGKHSQEIIGMLLEGVRVREIAKRLGLRNLSTRMAIERYYDKIGVPSSETHNRHVMFVLHENPLRDEIRALRSKVETELCLFPDLPCIKQQKSPVQL